MLNHCFLKNLLLFLEAKNFNPLLTSAEMKFEGFFFSIKSELAILLESIHCLLSIFIKTKYNKSVLGLYRGKVSFEIFLRRGGHLEPRRCRLK